MTSGTGDGFINGGPVLNTPLALLLVQIMIITILSRVFLGFPLKKIKQPMVIAEMIAGILLGPSAMGNIKGFKENIFPDDSIARLALVSQIGLVLYMFVVGLELNIQQIRRESRKALLSALIGLIAPFTFAIPLVWALDSDKYYTGEKGIFFLFMGVTMAIAALPVLARILGEFRVLQSPLGTFTILAATADDVMAWPLLALASALARAANYLSLLWLALALIGYALFMWFCVRYLLRFVDKKIKEKKRYNNFTLFVLFTTLFLVSWYCEIIGLTALIGALSVGALIPRENDLHEVFQKKIRELVMVVFLPLFFTISGLRTKFGLLDDAETWGLTVLIIVLSCISKIGSCMISSKSLGALTWKQSVAFGILMNTKGLVALITLNIGLSAGIITERLFAMLVLMVLFDTFMTCPAVWLVYKLTHGNFREDNQRIPEVVGVIMEAPHQPHHQQQQQAASLKAIELGQMTAQPNS